MIKKLLMVGNFETLTSSENDYLVALEELGIEVTALQENGVSGDLIEKAALHSDALFWVHTHGWSPTGKPMRDVLLSLKYAGVPSFGYHLDLWMGLARQADLGHDDYWRTDYFFTVDRLMADYLNKTPNMPKAFYIKAGVAKSSCYMAKLADGSFPEIVFVGSKNYHPEWPYRPLLIDWLSRTYGDRFAHYGNDGLGTVRGATLNAVYANSKIVIGDALCIGFDYPDYTSDRLYETTGRGGFLIHPNIKGVETSFVNGKELVLYDFGDFVGLKAKIDYYLTHDAEREAIRSAGQARTLRDHTYTARLKQILTILDKETK